MRNTKRRHAPGKPKAQPARVRVQKSRHEREAEIFDAALQEFAEQGYTGTRMQDIAARIGVSRTDIYRYFATKEILFEAVLRQWTERHVTAFETIASSEGFSHLVLLQRLLETIHQRLAWRESRLLLKIVLGEGSLFPEAARAYYQAVVARSLTAISEVVARGVACGEFDANFTAASARIIFAPALLGAIWLTAFNGVDPLDLEDFRRTHLAQIEEWVNAKRTPVIPHKRKVRPPSDRATPSFSSRANRAG